MSIGDQWHKFGMGSMDKETSFKLLDAFYDARGDFIDTAYVYQDETSEMFIGEWAEKRGIRDQLVIATKYSTNFKRATKDMNIKLNYVGNNAKSLKISVEASLKKKCTPYIDILYAHWWDYQTPIEEVMDQLHNLVVAGKVLYLGVSDTPAWVVSAANQYTKNHGETLFCIYLGAWNVMERSFQSEIIPMSRSLGLTLAPWNVLAAGRLHTDAEEEARLASGEKGRTLINNIQGEWKRNEAEKKISAALEKVTKEVGTEHITAVAIAYVMQKTPYMFPIIGGRKVEHLVANIEAPTISLCDKQIKYIESVLPFDPGFPGTATRPCLALDHVAHWDRWPHNEPLRPVANA